MNSKLSVVSINCRGLTSSLCDVRELCAKYDTILLQETWLAKQNQDTLSTISDDFNWYGISNVDCGQGPIAGIVE